MPTYDYHCCACDVEFSAIQKMTDSHLVKCQHCGKEALKRLLSVPNIIVTGKEREPPQSVRRKLDAKTKMHGMPFHPLPKDKQHGLSVLSHVGGVGFVEHANLAGRPPGSYGKEGRIVFVKEDKKPRNDRKDQNKGQE